jgi:hypothetical protein
MGDAATSHDSTEAAPPALPERPTGIQFGILSPQEVQAVMERGFSTGKRVLTNGWTLLGPQDARLAVSPLKGTRRACAYFCWSGSSCRVLTLVG